MTDFYVYTQNLQIITRLQEHIGKEHVRLLSSPSDFLHNTDTEAVLILDTHHEKAVEWLKVEQTPPAFIFRLGNRVSIMAHRSFDSMEDLLAFLPLWKLGNGELILPRVSSAASSQDSPSDQGESKNENESKESNVSTDQDQNKSAMPSDQESPPEEEQTNDKGEDNDMELGEKQGDIRSETLADHTEAKHQSESAAPSSEDFLGKELPEDERQVAATKGDSSNPSLSEEHSFHSNQEDRTTPLWIMDKYLERSIMIKKGLFHPTRFQKNHVIGIWSPFHRIGVSTFTTTLACFIAQYHPSVAVLEALNRNQQLYSTLTRWGVIPNDWHSFADVLMNEGYHPEEVVLQKEGVYWFPLGPQDAHYEWNPDMIRYYITTAKYFDVTLIDLPTGEMNEATLDTLEHCTELWILVDNHYVSMLEWSSYINALQTRYRVPFYLVHTRTYPFSQPERLSKQLKVPLLVSLEPMEEYTQFQYASSEPLWQHPAVQKGWKEPFRHLLLHLFPHLKERVAREPHWKKLFVKTLSKLPLR
jgi:hypothetical protein